MKRWFIGSVLVFTFAGCANDSEPPPAAPARTVTRGVAPTEAELQAYRAQLSQMLSHTVKAEKASDTEVRSLSLEGYGSVAVVKLTEEGNLATACVDDAQQAIDFLSDVKTGSGGLEEK